MAHTFDAKVLFRGNGNPLTQAYTCGAGTTLLVLGVVGATNERENAAPTFNGVAMQQAVEDITSTETRIEYWFMLDPPTGAEYTISIPNSGALTLNVCAASFKAQSGWKSFVDTFVTASGTAANPSAALTPSVNGDVIVQVCGDGYNGVPSANSHTLLYSSSADTVRSANFQYALVADTSETTMGWTVASDDYSIITVAFREYDPADTIYVWPTKDTSLSQSANTTVYGLATAMYIKGNGTSSARARLLIAFDVSSLIPEGATISAATLFLYCSTAVAGQTFNAYRLLRTDWVEAEATWNIYKTGANWGTGGALNTSTDFDASVTTTAASLEAPGWVSFDALDFVQTAMNSVGGIVNILCADLDADGNVSNTFRQKDASTMAVRWPYLHVEFTEAAAVTFIPQCIFL